MLRNILHDIQLQIFDYFGLPESEAVAIDVLARSLWDGAAVRPGSRGDVRQYRMDNDYSDIAERDKDDYVGKVPALGSGWRPHSEDNDPKDWQQIQSAKERDLIQNALGDLYAERGPLALKPTADLTDNEKERLREIDILVAQLNTHGFLEAVPGTQIFGDDVNCIYRSMSAANVPFRYRCRRVLEWKRPITHYLYWFKPRDGQVNHYFEIDMGDTLRLLLEGGDKATLFRKHEDRDTEEWETTDQLRKALLAKRYLSEAQATQIQTERDEIEKIRKTGKDAKRKLTPDEEARIEQRRNSIKTIQAQIGLTDAEKAQVKEYEEFLFRQIETLDWNESALSLYNRPLTITCFDYGMGTAAFVLNIGRNAYIFRDKYLTKKRDWTPLWGTPTNKRDPNFNGAQKLQLSGGGGAFIYKQGYVKINRRDELVSAPMHFGRRLPTGVIPVNGLKSQNLPAGCDVTFEIREIDGFDDLLALIGIEIAPQYQVVVTFTSDGKTLPLLFRANIQIPATPRAANVKVWDSADYPNAIITFTSQMDSARRSVLYQLKIKNTGGNLNLPTAMRERVGNLLVDGQPAITGGLFADEGTTEIKKVITTSGNENTWTEWTFTLVDKGRPARAARFKKDLVFDGMYLGDAVRLAYGSVGYTNTELAGVPTGAAGGLKLPTAAPGEKAAIRATKGARVDDYVQGELVGRFGLGRRCWWDRSGVLNLGLLQARVLAGINYKGSLTATNARRQYFNTIERSLNTEDYFTFFRVEGATDIDTGKPLAAEHRINEATDVRFKGVDSRYIGYDKDAEIISDEALNEQHYVDIALQTKVLMEGKPREVWKFQAPYASDILAGDVFQVEGQNWELVSTSPAEILDDEMIVEVQTPLLT